MAGAEDANGAIAVFTSGGDAPGMNAVVRSVVRCAVARGRKVFAIQEGYQGMVDGGALIKEMRWEDVQMIIHKGGTVIGSARCKDFRERPGRLKACKNLVKRNIVHLICCGGDGSLTGANIFKLEWSDLVRELLEKQEITQEEAKINSALNLVGCVGSIDNDMVFDGTLTIGAATALHRIVEAIDAVQSTASSHQRTFVLEIMGRHCGYLTWAAGIATGADFVFIPEAPSKHNDWESVLCSKLDRQRRHGARLCTVLVAEGAIDKFGKPIKTDYVKQVIVDRLKHDTRTTVLGHVQRGGNACSHDRVLGTIIGAVAVEKLLRSDPSEKATIVGVKGFNATFNLLTEAVEATQKVGKYTAELDFTSAIQARGHSFQKKWNMHKSINRDIAKHESKVDNGRNICIITCGAPAAGMNAAVRAACHFALNYGCCVYAAVGGFDGFASSNLLRLQWMDVTDWAGEGGSLLRTDRSIPHDAASINQVIEKYQLNSLLIVGGFDGLHGMCNLCDQVQIPLVYIPASISNNIPGTDFSIGCDTALNAIIKAIDTCKRSADSSSSRVFIIETQGRNCGFLAMTAALASGSDVVYTREEGVTLSQMERDIARIKEMIARGLKRHFVVVRNEFCSDAYDLGFMETLFAEEGKGTFSVRTVKLGHLCQGAEPSPLDRIRACVNAAFGVEVLLEAMENKSSGYKVVVGYMDSDMHVTPIKEVCEKANWEERIQRGDVPWSWHLQLFKDLAGFPFTLEEKENYVAFLQNMTSKF